MRKAAREKKLGRIKFYADENVDLGLIRYLREKHKVNIVAAVEQKLTGREDDFHFQEAQRRGRWLLTNDRDFLDHRRFPLHSAGGIVILNPPRESPGIGWSSLWLEEHIVPSGTGIAGTKIVVYGETAEIHHRDETGRIRRQILSLQGEPAKYAAPLSAETNGVWAVCNGLTYGLRAASVSERRTQCTAESGRANIEPRRQ